MPPPYSPPLGGASAEAGQRDQLLIPCSPCATDRVLLAVVGGERATTGVGFPFDCAQRLPG
eukprot:15076423-Alexandrium_andersonii.AAC.1